MSIILARRVRRRVLCDANCEKKTMRRKVHHLFQQCTVLHSPDQCMKFARKLFSMQTTTRVYTVPTRAVGF